jgi:hypothetical protein
MGRTYDTIDEKLAEFIEAQPVFFVATAPLDSHGHINCSPKGNRRNLAVLGPHRIAYQDLTGSGIETISHLRENGRIVLMVCAFDGPPRIVRLHGRGEVLEPTDPGFAAVATTFPAEPGIRAVIVVHVERIADSCGYGVPIMPFDHHRPNMDHWTDTKGPEGLAAYRADHNATGIDGLPGLVPGHHHTLVAPPS